MTQIGIVQILSYLVILLLCVKPLGWYMARVYENQPCGLDRFLGPVERFIYRLSGIIPELEMNWKNYLGAMLLFNLLGFLLNYILLRCQAFLPLNPQAFAAMAPDLAFNTTSSFVTNTDWQNYGGENTLSYFSQMVALTVQNFLSAATGMALLIAFIRGVVRHETTNLGNFWVDIVRTTLYILLPLAFIFAVVLSSQGVIQNLKTYQTVNLIEPLGYEALPDNTTDASLAIHKVNQEQIIPMGPVASQVAIKQLATNGGGFFNANSAHPFENPTPLTNFLELLAILLIPAALCYTFGMMAHDKRQGWAILIAMSLILVPLMFVSVYAEQQGNPKLTALNISPIAQKNDYPGGNMEGKETRFGIVNSAMWGAATAATSNGSVNAMLDSFTPLGGLVSLWLIQLGEVIFGGVGSGLSGMLILVIVAVFVAGLMVGRTPEYLGKKIDPFEIKMASTAILITPLVILMLTAITIAIRMGAGTGNAGTHGFSEILYAFTSMVNNNGSAFAGLNANDLFYNSLGGVGMLLGRYWIAIPTLALAGSLARKKIIPSGPGTLPTHTPLFVILLVCVTLIIGALTFFPALSLGPIVEQLMLWG